MMQFRANAVGQRHARTAAVIAACVAGVCLQGCGTAQQGLGSLISQTATTTTPPGGQSGGAAAISTGSTPPAAGAPAAAEPAHGAGNIHLVVAGSRLAVYERVARQALKCWLGGEGPLKGSHVFGAEVPPDGGDGLAKGVTEIGIYQKDATQPAARGLRAYRIAFEPYGDGQVTVDSANSKIAADLAAAMGRDVEAWARGEDGCIAQTVKPPVTPATAAAPTPAGGKAATKPGSKAGNSAGAKTKKPATPPAAG